ncbi:MAG: MmgE/PrpD family protein [Acidipropionibacterium sp.]|jgi:2-methylcitrate dehydratase PrpD|nr:MmgE/PrpD family protein [Acidipropionibacterium sp.]
MISIDEAVTLLARWAAQLDDVSSDNEANAVMPGIVRAHLAAQVGGGALSEHQRLLRAWGVAGGPVAVSGAELGGSIEQATWLNAVAAVSQERDEGNRHARGHAAAQVLPAVLAVAEAFGACGSDLRAALLVGYETAVRVGAATDFAPGTHTHGAFGAMGVAAGCARLLNLDAATTALAIDLARHLAAATSWEVAVAGSPVRDQWMGAAGLGGLAALRLARTGDGGPRMTDDSLSGVLGRIDPERLVADLGRRYLATEGYLKEFSSCQYTHSAAQAAVALRSELAARGLTPDDIVSIRAVVTGPAVDLTATEWASRHAAWFSVPFAVAAAIRYGDVGFERSASKEREALAPWASRVRVVAAEAPSDGSRPARLSAQLADGSVIVREVPHARGDRVLSPMTPAQEDAALACTLAPATRRFGVTLQDLTSAAAALWEGKTVASVMAAITASTHLTPSTQGVSS